MSTMNSALLPSGFQRFGAFGAFGRWAGGLKKVPWTPNFLSTVAWYDASDTSSTNIVHVGGSISQWSDKSGNGRHATQASVAQQPSTETTTIGGLNAISFDGSNDILASDPIAAAIGPNPFTIFTALKSSTTNNALLLTMREFTGTTTRGYLHRGTANTFTTWWGDPTVTIPVPIEDNTDSIVGFSRTAVGLAQNYVNGTPSEETAVSMASPFGFFSIGGLRTSTSTTGLGYSNVKFGEILVAIGELSLADRQQVEGYLAWKWNLVVKLPSNHPYKLNPPSKTIPANAVTFN